MLKLNLEVGIVDDDTMLRLESEIERLSGSDRGSIISLKELLDIDVILSGINITRDCSYDFQSDIDVSMSCVESVIPKYIPYEFDHVWQLVKDYEDGVKFYTKKNHIESTYIDNLDDLLTYQHRLYIIKI